VGALEGRAANKGGTAGLRGQRGIAAWLAEALIDLEEGEPTRLLLVKALQTI